MTSAEIISLLDEMRKANYHSVGVSFFEQQNAKLDAAGWIFAVHASSYLRTKTRKGRPLRCPRLQWGVYAYYYNQARGQRAFYYAEEVRSKAEALKRQSTNPAPSGTYETITL